MSHQFSEILNTKQISDVCILGCAKIKRKANITGNFLLSIIPNHKEHIKINGKLKKEIYDWV